MSSVIEQSARERARELAARGAVDELTGMLCSQDWRERQEAAFALSQMGSVVVEPMIRVLGNRELSWEARGHAAWVLRHVGGPLRSSGAP
ncbi:MAG: hypothetical protein KatS3mg115_1157 [Candidatus Poribacteria bacterium]|nr:MAG: hypothetical protein KatS3mg115_1157 [Candidatus Poribacteria bacterium]